MSKHNRCDGWAQCSICHRSDGTPVIPKHVATTRPDSGLCRFVVPCCPPSGAHCSQQPRTSSKRLNRSCSEFLPAPCSAMPAINCAPNLPTSGWSVLSWRPGPAATRTCPRTQHPKAPCRTYTNVPCNSCPAPRACDRPNDGRYMRDPPRCPAIWHVRDREPLGPACPRPCNPVPPMPIYACGLIGTRRLTEHVHQKFSYPGYEGGAHGPHVKCPPRIPCCGVDVGFENAASSPVSFDLFFLHVSHNNDIL